METSVTVSFAESEKLKAAIKKAENKLSEFKEAARELEEIQIEVQLK